MAPPLEVAGELNRIAKTVGLDEAGAANAYAGTVGLEAVGALNVKLSRSSAPLNTNMGFESGTAGWTAVGGTLAISTTVFHSGIQAGQLTPDGITATVHVDSNPIPVTPGASYVVAAWLRCSVARTINFNLNWYDGGGAYILTSGIGVPVAANTWAFATADFSAPSNGASARIAPTLISTPPASNVLYMDDVTLIALTNGGLEMQGVCNALAGTSGLGVVGALSAIPTPP